LHTGLLRNACKVSFTSLLQAFMQETSSYKGADGLAHAAGGAAGEDLSFDAGGFLAQLSSILGTTAGGGAAAAGGLDDDSDEDSSFYDDGDGGGSSESDEEAAAASATSGAGPAGSSATARSAAAAGGPESATHSAGAAQVHLWRWLRVCPSECESFVW